MGILLSAALHAAPLHLTFTHAEGDRPLLIGSLRYDNAAGETYSATRLSYLVSDIVLHRGEEETFRAEESVGFIDGAGAHTGVRLDGVPEGDYTGISFSIGIDSERNHSDPARHPANHPLNPTLNKLHWDWQGGYIFMAIEGHWRKPGERLPEGYAYHFANDPNLTRVTVDGTIKIADQSEAVISLDLGKLLDGLSFGADGATTHSRPGDPVAARLRANLPGAFRLLRAGPVRRMPEQPKLAPIDLPAAPTPYPVTLPSHIPIPALPLDNPLIRERVELGEKLFHETKLSRTNVLSCASCHQGEALSDPRRFSPGVDGKHGKRHAMPLVNLAWKTSFFWDGRAPSLREQVLVPIQDHLELDESLENVVAKLKSDPAYPPLFAAAFGSGEISPRNISLALENFLLTRLSFDSKLDRMIRGKARLTAEEERGRELFFTEQEPRLGQRGADCFHCHGGTLFSDHGFHHNGLLTDDPGLGGVTGKPEDRHKFSTPSLRNIALTAPYMHDGRFATLEEVIEHYNSPIPRTETLDPNIAKHPGGLGLSEADKAALIAFLKAL